jgi:hypothetical protein
MIWILILLAIYVISFWVYGYHIHKVMEERDFWQEQAEIADAHTRKIMATYTDALNQVPASVRDHYRRKA